MKKISQWLIMFAIVTFLTIAVFGQEQYGNIEGTIKDPQGAVVSNVSVTIVNPNTGFKRTTTTNSNGFFRVIQLPPGSYTVSTDAVTGFGATKNENVIVTLGNTTPVDVEVKVGAGTTVVDVSATDVQPIDTSGSKVSTNLSAKQIELLPKGTTFLGVLEAPSTWKPPELVSALVPGTAFKTPKKVVPFGSNSICLADRLVDTFEPDVSIG